MRMTLLSVTLALAAFAAGLYSGTRRPAVAHTRNGMQGRPSTASLPQEWGRVKAALGRDEITLILEDEAGTIRAVTLERAVTEKGEPAVAPRLFAVVPRN